MEINDDIDVKNYTSMLANGMDCTKKDVKDMCVVVTTIETSYPMAFIDFEDEHTLGINYTMQDGTERFVVVNKDCIVDVSVMYQQDLDIIEIDNDTNKHDPMYQ